MTQHYSIGLTSGGMTDVVNLSSDAVNPIGDFRRWAEVIDLGDGLARGMGRPIATWYWCWIPPLLRQALKAYCSGKSARVYIRTEDDPTGLHTVYQAAMIWPDNEALYDQSEFRIVFRDLVTQNTT